MARITLSTRIAAAPARCFDLSLSVEVHLQSTASSSERVVAGVASGALALGDRVTWEARHFGRRRRMTVEITAYEHPTMFRDEQVHGPFRRFAHEHVFEPVGDATTMHDVLEFSLFPAFDRLVLVPYLRRFLSIRNETIRGIAEADG
jgi:ligand-binding SRPBCC domain-containing protein